MREVSASHSNAVMARHGFAPAKGDARRVASAASRGDGSDWAILSAAADLGIRRLDLDSQRGWASDAARADSAAAGIAAHFDGRRIGAGSVHEAMNAIASLVRAPGDLPLVRRLFTHPALGSILSRGGRRRLAEAGDAWEDMTGGRRTDFGGRLAALFFCLDDAWMRDGRPWHAAVTQGPVTSTFCTDNWLFFLAFALTGGGEGLPRRYSVTLQRLDPAPGPDGGLEAESAGCLLIDGRQVSLLSAAEASQAKLLDPMDGSPMPPGHGVRFADVASLVPGLSAALRPDGQHRVTAGSEIRDFAAVALAEAGGKGAMASLSPSGCGVRVLMLTRDGQPLDARIFGADGSITAAEVRRLVGSLVGVIEDASAAPTLPPRDSAAGCQPERCRQGFQPRIIQGGKAG